MTGEVKVLALAAYPVAAAATRLRLLQLVSPLAERGIEMTVRPFLDPKTYSGLHDRTAWKQTMTGVMRGLAARTRDALTARDADVLLIHREALMIGPPLFEWLARRVGHGPIVLDLDDPTYLRYESPDSTRLATYLSARATKTDTLISWSDLVFCGNRNIAEYVGAQGVKSTVVPTVVNTDYFCPRQRMYSDGPPVVGWVGSPSTFRYLLTLLPILRRLSQEYAFVVRLVGSGMPSSSSSEGIRMEMFPWTLDTELESFQSIDIGLYPLIDDAWSQGKSGLKAIQYMAVGVPYVAAPVGVVGEIGVPGLTHFTAKSERQWYEALRRLLDDSHRRRLMGIAGRNHALKNFTVGQVADTIAQGLRSALTSHRADWNRTRGGNC